MPEFTHHDQLLLETLAVVATQQCVIVTDLRKKVMATAAQSAQLSTEISNLKTALAAYQAREQATIDSLTSQVSNLSSGSVDESQQLSDLQGVIDSLAAPVVPPPASTLPGGTGVDTTGGAAAGDTTGAVNVGTLNTGT